MDLMDLMDEIYIYDGFGVVVSNSPIIPFDYTSSKPNKVFGHLDGHMSNTTIWIYVFHYSSHIYHQYHYIYPSYHPLYKSNI